MTNCFQQWRLIALFLLINAPFTAQAQWENLEGPIAGSTSLPVGNGNSLYVYNADDIYKSDDDGASWYIISENLPHLGWFWDVQVSGNTVIALKTTNNPNAITASELYISQNGGQDWKYLPLPAADSDYSGVLLLSDKVIFSVNGLIYEMRFSEMRWRPSTLNDLGGFYLKFAKIKDKIYATGFSSIAKSSDEGLTWTVINAASVPVGYPDYFWAKGDTMFVTRYIDGNGGNSGDKTFRTFNGGQSWSSQVLFEGAAVTGVVDYKGAWFGCNSGRLVRSFNSGANWQVVPDVPSPGYPLLASRESGLYMLSGQTPLLWRTQTATNQVFTQIQDGVRGGTITAVYSNDSVVLVGADRGGIHRFRKNTGEWSPGSIFPFNHQIGAIAYSGNRLLAGMNFDLADEAVFFSDDNGATWNTSFISAQHHVYADVEKISCANHRCVAYRNFLNLDPEWFSENDGSTWSDPGVAGSEVTDYENYFYGINYTGKHLDISTDGLTWFPLPSIGIDSNERIEAFYPLDNFICLWTSAFNSDSLSLYTSEDDGFTWTRVFRRFGDSLFPPPVWGKKTFLVNWDDNHKLVYSTDKGVHWFPLPPNEQNIGSVNAVDDHYLYAADNFLYRLPYTDRHYRQVKITAFHDLNQNNVKEPGEPDLPGVLLRAPSAGYLMATDSTGSVQMTLNIAPGASDTILVSTPQSFELVAASSAIPVSATDTVVYAAFTTTTTHDIGVFSGQTRPLLAGHSAAAIAVVKNTGGAVFSDNAQLKILVPGLLSSGTITPAPDGQSGDTLLWNIPSLMPDSTLLVTFKYASPASPVWGDHYLLQAWIDVPAPDDVADNNFTAIDIAPSWKEEPYWNFVNKPVVSVQQVAAGNAGLVYCSGFENLYPSPFFPVTNVQFYNVFRPEFDLSTLRIIAASHKVSVRTLVNGDIAFYLQTPPLPDTSAGDASRCYVLYTIDPVRELEDRDFIAHFAEARFDKNSGYSGESNMAITQVKDGPVDASQLPVAGEYPVSISPNPSNGTFRIDTGGKDIQNAMLTITDSGGKLCYSALWNGGEVHVNLTPGVYMVQLGNARAVRVTIF